MLILSIPKVPASEFLQPQGAKVAQTPPCHQKCKQGRVRLKSQHRISLGDSWPLLTHQPMAASAVPGQCLGHFLHLWAPRELPLNFLYPKVSVRACLCLTTICFLRASAIWGSLALNFPLIFLLICICLHVGTSCRAKANMW